MRRIILSVACIGLLCSFATAKTWKSGDYSVQGSFLEIDDDDKVVIRQDDTKKIIRIALDKLNDLDRRFAEQKDGRDNKIDEILKDRPYDRALRDKNRGEFEKARDGFNEALEKGLDKANALKSLGDIALGQDSDHDEAIGFYDKAIEADPEHAGAYKSRSLAKLVKDEAEHGDEWTEAEQKHMNKMVRENMRDHPWEPISSMEYDTPLRKMAKLDFNKYLYLERLHMAGGTPVGGPGPGGPGPGPLAKGYGIVIGLGLAQGLGTGAGEIKPDEAEGIVYTSIYDKIAAELKAKQTAETEPQSGEGEAIVGKGAFSAFALKLGSYKAPEAAEDAQPENDGNAQVAVGESAGSGLAGGLLKHAGFNQTSENED